MQQIVRYIYRGQELTEQKNFQTAKGYEEIREIRRIKSERGHLEKS